MQTYASRLSRLAFSIALTVLSASAADIRGTVMDPTGAAIPDAEVSAVSRVGILTQTSTNMHGSFELKLADAAGVRLVVTAPGFETKTLPAATDVQIRLGIAPQTDTVRVVGSTIDVPMSESGASASVILREEIQERNEALASDLLRYVPGLLLNQAGPRGTATGLFIRGGDSNFNLVQIDGVTVNAFGGAFDFAHLPAERLERIEVVRGPQSAVYGSYANSGVVNLVTRPPQETPSLDALVEGGTYQERRFALGAAGTYKGFGLTGWASRMDSDGPVENSNYRNQGVTLGVSRAFARQSIHFHGNFNNNDVGATGPYGSDPMGLFPGLDTYSRNRNNSSNYIVRYQADIGPRVRQELFGTFFLNNNYYKYIYGDSTNQDLRGQAETRTLVSVTRFYTTSFGFAWTREQETNTWITGDDFHTFPLRRNQEGIYWENRLELARRLFLNAGLRTEVIHTGHIPGNTLSGRPDLAAQTITKVNPKVAAAYVLGSSTRLHASFGTGIRPPAGFDLAFTNNPALRPERTASFDAGIAQRVFNNRLALDATYFQNRYSDLIVSLGASLAQLSNYRSDNLSNSRAEGAEFSARLQPARNIWLVGNYTYLRSRILSLDGSVDLAPAYFRIGQELLRRPKHSGSAVAGYTRGRFSGNLTGYFRSDVLDVEPNWGASMGLWRNPGFFNMGVNVNLRLAHGVTAYGHLRNALNRRYEEVYGYPAPLLNFVAGLKFTLPRGQ
ncbi:MAG TPA: TonB-dependent receptor [Bryobacteraceae bacterium]|nr:TonB-dependent receptor [Bryobacteraceae bacterium]